MVVVLRSSAFRFIVFSCYQVPILCYSSIHDGDVLSCRAVTVFLDVSSVSAAVVSPEFQVKPSEMVVVAVYTHRSGQSGVLWPKTSASQALGARQ